MFHLGSFKKAKLLLGVLTYTWMNKQPSNRGWQLRNERIWQFNKWDRERYLYSQALSNTTSVLIRCKVKEGCNHGIKWIKHTAIDRWSYRQELQTGVTDNLDMSYRQELQTGASEDRKQ